MKRLSAILWLLLAALPASAQTLTLKVGVLRQTHSRETLSLLDIPATDDGLAGALLGAIDNNTTGKFIQQSYEVIDSKLDQDATIEKEINALIDQDVQFIIADLPAQNLLNASAIAKKRDALLFNISAPDVRLREEDCRANIIHIAPDHAMLADGLAQYLIWKQWRRWFLIKGSHAEDELLAQAYRRAAKKFGAKIIEERLYEDTGGGRRSDSGSVQTQRQMPMLTQNAVGHDVLLAVDENNVFAAYLPYRTWEPKLVVGSAGLTPTNWDAAHEQWGAHQLQNRFIANYHRAMNARDNAAWLAMRMIGEAAVRTRSNRPADLLTYMLDKDFSIAAFKGLRLTLRSWNQQLRQPILLSDGRMTISVSPQEGFLHQTSELDTLGYDQPETKCRLK
jgi:ABC transporter substrate binding protein (PQQ-dependent alcohol dehydrogenase system)